MATTYYIDGAVGSDSNAGTSPGAGNAWATIGKFCSSAAGADLGYIKASATYTISATLVPPAGTSGRAPTRLIGYTSSPGDNGQVTVKANATLSGSGTPYLFNLTNSYVWLYNIIANGDDGAGGHATRGFSLTAAFNRCINCTVKNVTQYAFFGSATNSLFLGCWATLNSGTGAFILWAASSTAIDCVASANTCPGFYLEAVTPLIRCVAINNTGGTTDGILNDFLSAGFMVNCISSGNGRDGLRLSAAGSVDATFMENCIFSSNGGYGVNDSNAAEAAPIGNYNAFYNNTSGARNQVVAGANDVTLSGDPFTNLAGGDFSLNNTAGAGAACRAAGFPGVFPSGLTTGYLDIGAAQSQASGGSAGMLFVPNMEGT